MYKMALGCLKGRMVHILALYFPLVLLSPGLVLFGHGAPNGMSQNLQMAFLERAVLTSPLFPSCCEPASYKLTCRDGLRDGHIRLLFSSLDVPPDSTVLIYDGQNSSARYVPFLPMYLRTAWTRPVIVSKGMSLFVQFTPGSVGKHTYTGFEMEIYCTPAAEWRLAQPLTDCPPVRDTMDGGYIEVMILHLPWQRNMYQYDCVWQIKPPTGFEGLNVYLHVLAASRDVSLVVNEGRTTVLRQMEGFLDTPVLFSSSKGFYVRLKKSIDSGFFQFTYGVYKNVTSIQDCSFDYGGGRHQGFWCDYGSWCLPMAHLCNNLQNCPNGHDEDSIYCHTRAIIEESGVSKTHHLSSYPCEVLCLDGTCQKDITLCTQPATSNPIDCLTKAGVRCYNGCLYNEQNCGNGICVGLYDKCPGARCSGNEKLCSNGICMQSYERCYEDSCPPYKSFRCAGGAICLYETEVCDGHIDCPGGEDEGRHRCADSSFFTLYTVLGFLVFPFFMTCLACRMAIRNKPPPRLQEERERRLRQRVMNAARRSRQPISLPGPAMGLRPFAHQYPPGEAPDILATQRPLVVRTQSRRDLPPEYDYIDLLPPSYDEATGAVSLQELPPYSSTCNVAQPPSP